MGCSYCFFLNYREEGDTDFMEDFSEVTLLNVVTTATKACQDSDKVKANGVRSLGNILRYLSAKNISKCSNHIHCSFKFSTN